MKRNLICFIFLTPYLLGCEGYLDRYPLDSPSSANFPKSKTELEMAVIGTYNSLYKKVGGGYMQDELFWDNATDLGFIRGSYENVEAILTGTASTLAFDAHWTNAYSGIQRANFILNNMENARLTIDGDICDRAESEAMFIRAYHYMHLTERFGDVPLVLNVLGLGEAGIERTKKALIIDQLFSDLDHAATFLPDSYSGNGEGRATKGAALALKARIALYNGRYEEARNAAKSVMQLGYTLESDYSTLFQLGGEGSAEIIFQLPHHPEVVPNKDHVFLGGRAGAGNWSITVPSQQLVDAYLCIDGKTIAESPFYNPAKPFENRDPRLKQSIVVPQTWVAGDLFETHPDSTSTWRNRDGIMQRIGNLEVTNQYATFTGYLWRKNWDLSQYWTGLSGRGALSVKLIRYAEVLLTYAEACVELNEIDESVFKAIDDIRKRSGMPPVDKGISTNEMRNIVRHERKIELAGEGFRLYDIRRWKIAEHVIPGNMPGRKNKEFWYNPGVPQFGLYGEPIYTNQEAVYKTIQVRVFDINRDYLWAIPQREIDLNPKLTQNSGY